jgi:hypothetical protein
MFIILKDTPQDFKPKRISLRLFKRRTLKERSFSSAISIHITLNGEAQIALQSLRRNNFYKTLQDMRLSYLPLKANQYGSEEYKRA